MKILNAIITSNNKLMTFAIKEIVKNHFNSTLKIVSPLALQLQADEQSLGLEDIIFIDASLLFNKAIRQKLLKKSSTRLIAIANGETDIFLRYFVEDIIDGIIDNSHEIDTIVMVISAVVNGFQCLPQRRQTDTKERYYISKLTQREQEVFYLISEGATNKEIADLLGVSYKTVCVHRYNITYKLKIKKNSELTRLSSLTR